MCYNLKKQKGFRIDPYLLAFLIIVLVGCVVGYAYYLREKNGDLREIEQGKCPACHKEGIEEVDRRGGGCSPRVVTFKCPHCKYENSFTIPGNCSL